MNQVEIRPLPEMLGRKDAEHGTWVIKPCSPVRGQPMTSIVGREMHVPLKDEAVDRVIRAHEMAHAKFSPAQDFPKWIERKRATQMALTVVEEVRVNFLIGKAGFDLKLLKDGTEIVSGVRTAEQNDWAIAVYTAVGYALCGGGKEFLTGVRRVNRVWGATLKDIIKEVEKEFTVAWKKGNLGSTEVDAGTGLSPLGFSHTERIAEWVDRLANPPQDEKGDEDGKNEKGEKDGKNPKEGETDDDEQDTKDGAKDEPKPVDPKKVRPANADNKVASTWYDLQIGKVPLPRKAHGGLGRKRKAHNVGRNPRRIGNALVDPQRRVFDQYRKGDGGIVLIDGSGSMRLTNADILKLTETAPGCTVAVYSTQPPNNDNGVKLADNLWVLADKGRMVAEIPERKGGNGVDAPAIRWAIKQRKKKSTPVVWITDGKVHGTGGGGYKDSLAMDCIREVVKHGVHMALNVESGVKLLNQLNQKKRPKKWFPRCWNETNIKLNGRQLG